MKKSVFAMMAAGLLMAAAAQAQEEPKFTAKPSGRILMDAAYINAQHQRSEGQVIDCLEKSICPRNL